MGPPYLTWGTGPAAPAAPAPTGDGGWPWPPGPWSASAAPTARRASRARTADIWNERNSFIDGNILVGAEGNTTYSLLSNAAENMHRIHGILKVPLEIYHWIISQCPFPSPHRRRRDRVEVERTTPFRNFRDITIINGGESDSRGSNQGRFLHRAALLVIPLPSRHFWIFPIAERTSNKILHNQSIVY